MRIFEVKLLAAVPAHIVAEHWLHGVRSTLLTGLIVATEPVGFEAALEDDGVVLRAVSQQTHFAFEDERAVHAVALTRNGMLRCVSMQFMGLPVAQSPINLSWAKFVIHAPLTIEI